ncbi:hypothetical protein BH23VER1_BH23VER1_25850 [soil metagenome]
MNSEALRKDMAADRVVAAARGRRIRRRVSRTAAVVALMGLAWLAAHPPPPQAPERLPVPPVARQTVPAPIPDDPVDVITTDEELLDALSGTGAIIVTQADGTKFLIVKNAR